MSIKPTDYPQGREARLDQEWRAYDQYYSDQTLKNPYFYHDPKKEGRFLDSLMARFGILPNQNILDIGCGNGFHSGLFHQRGLQVTGVDRSAKAIDYCRKIYGAACNWICDDAFNLNQPGQFDYVSCYFLTYFNAFDDLRQAESNASRLMDYLRPGGKLFFIWHSDLTAVRLPPDRFSVMNYTIPQLKQLFSGYSSEAYAIDSPASVCSLLGRFSFNKYVTRLSCARVYLQASSWKRARLILVVEK
jgi:SAM-dependent methyltransferase